MVSLRLKTLPTDRGVLIRVRRARRLYGGTSTVAPLASGSAVGGRGGPAGGYKEQAPS